MDRKRNDDDLNNSAHSEGPSRLLLMCSKVKNIGMLQNAVLPAVTLVQYKFDTASLDLILAAVSQRLGNAKVVSIACIFLYSPTGIHIVSKESLSLSREARVCAQQEFLTKLVTNFIVSHGAGRRLDILGCGVLSCSDFDLNSIRDKVNGVSVGLHRDLGSEMIEVDGSRMSVGQLYFRQDQLHNYASQNQSLSGFEKIRTVGKGAYGTAVLYRKKDDDSLVILKEINLHDLNASERQMALNEVRVLAMLDHPNIISYYDSFEEDGIVMIEMEYADGGTLSQSLSQQNEPLEEKDILAMFMQIVAAIKYIHEHNILHRDLKTANIFLTKEGVVKVGDFGISKLMTTTNQGAKTVLGTPYYISPEMCEGKPYDDKSDMWALGCILYEMACLQRTFEGSNLPALVNKIMKGHFAPIKGDYSQEFKNLIIDLLQREPEYRPSASDIWNNRLPELMNRFDDCITENEDELIQQSEGTLSSQQNKRKTRSVLMYYEFSDVRFTPVMLPSKTKIRDVAVGSGHFIAVTVERMVFTWGKGSKGQLGHGNLESCQAPSVVEALKGKSIIRACCGEEFSMFVSDNGIIMTCGDGTGGCLGHGDWCSTSRPRLIEALLSVDVVSVACGSHHACAVGSENEVFTWGRGRHGRLGLGNEQDFCVPQEVNIPDNLTVRECFCGTDGTMLLTDVGSILAAGNNEGNKLCLNQRQGFLMAMMNIFTKTEVAGEKSFKAVRALTRYRVIDISMGPHHCAVVVEPGHVYTFGRNTHGQLGTGNTKEQDTVIQVKALEDKFVLRVRCGEFYSVAGTVDNELYFWGARQQTNCSSGSAVSGSAEIDSSSGLSSCSHSRQPSTASISSIASLKETVVSGMNLSAPAAENIAADLENFDKTNGNKVSTSKTSLSKATSDSEGLGECVFANIKEKEKSSSQTSLRGSSSKTSGSCSKVSSKGKSDSCSSDTKDEIIMQPTLLMRTDSKGAQSKLGDTVVLSKFYCYKDNMFLQVETTAPPPKKKSQPRKRYAQSVSSKEGGIQTPQVNRDGNEEYSSEASELDSSGVIPSWLKQELVSSAAAAAEVFHDDGNEADDTSDLETEEEGPPSLDHDAMPKVKRTLKPYCLLKIERDDSADAKKEPKADHRLSLPKITHLEEKMASVESGVECRDGLSSSSSSGTMEPSLMGEPVLESDRSKLLKKTSGVNPRKRQTVALSKAKSPSARQVTNPLHRIRSQAKTKRSDMKVSDRDTQVDNSLEMLQKELSRLQQEKLATEARLRLEIDKQKQQEAHSAKKAQTMKEAELLGEISILRKEMEKQSLELNANHNIVVSLQKQIAQLQEQQVWLREQNSSDSTRNSKICIVQ